MLNVPDTTTESKEACEAHLIRYISEPSLIPLAAELVCGYKDATAGLPRRESLSYNGKETELTPDMK